MAEMLEQIRERIEKLIFVFAILALVGCSRPPAPATTHWGSRISIGNSLYCDADGKEAASIVGGQSCLGKHGGCEYFETNAQAMQYAVANAHCEK